MHTYWTPDLWSSSIDHGDAHSHTCTIERRSTHTHTHTHTHTFYMHAHTHTPIGLISTYTECARERRLGQGFPNFSGRDPPK